MTGTASTRPYAIVTGASRGIGAAYAEALAAQGYDLLLVSRDESRLKDLSLKIGRVHHVEADVERLDLSEPDAAHRLYTAARRRGRAVDLLINNAGFGLVGPFVDLPTARIRDMLRLHTETTVESMRLFLPQMIERRTGAVINVASIAGFFAVPYFAEYAATKMFLISFSEALAEEVRPFGVRIQVCCPGTTESDFHRTAGFSPRSLLGTQTAAEVAACSLAALRKSRVVVLTGWRTRLLLLLGRCLPRALAVKIAARWMDPAKVGATARG